jgi:hypothetical protein
LFCQRGREFTRAHISLTKYPFLAIHAKGGESISPKQKDRTTTPISKIFGKLISIGIFQISIPQRNSISLAYFKEEVFKNWYLKYLIFFQFVQLS